MGFLGFVVGAGIAGHMIRKARKRAKEQVDNELNETSLYEGNKNVFVANSKQDIDFERMKTPCYFVDGFTEMEFKQMIKRAANKIKRLSIVSSKGPVIHGKVRSQSGVSDWEFVLDFNDYGHITGRSWIIATNNESEIPKRLAELIRYEINNSHTNRDVSMKKNKKKKCVCRYCYKKIKPEDRYCSSCGRKLK